MENDIPVIEIDASQFKISDWRSELDTCNFDTGSTDDASVAFKYYKDKIISIGKVHPFSIFLKAVFMMGYITGVSAMKKDLTLLYPGEKKIIKPDNKIHLVD